MKTVFFGVWALLFAWWSGVALAEGRTDLAHLHAGGAGRAPIGWLGFCAEQPRECLPHVAASEQRVTLTTANWRELVRVNLHFNRIIEPVTDQEQYGVIERWTYANSGRGDCEDYVLEKRRELVRLGWPKSALLITVVRDKEGLGHAVLTVVTDRGEYVLDNQTDEVLLWSQSQLTFIRRQSPIDPNAWLYLGGVIGLPEVVTATSGARP
jgi:predicted transglutaminase-like cysteine proteinase